MQTTTPTAQASTPLWVVAQSKHNANRAQKASNTLTRKHYFAILEEMKQLYKQHDGNELAFERDYTKHPSDKRNTMHCFLTNNFYWQLACTDDHDFVICYNAGNFKFNFELNKLVYWLPKNVRLEVSVEMPVPTMFTRCKRLQEERFFITL